MAAVCGSSMPKLSLIAAYSTGSVSALSAVTPTKLLGIGAKAIPTEKARKSRVELNDDLAAFVTIERRKNCGYAKRQVVALCVAGRRGHQSQQQSGPHPPISGRVDGRTRCCRRTGLNGLGTRLWHFLGKVEG